MTQKNRQVKTQDIIITGATGFVGKVLIKKIVKKFGHKNILCLVYNSNTQQEIKGRNLLTKLKAKYQIVDLTDFASLKNIPENPKLVIHLAAETDTSKKNHAVNDIGVKNLYKVFGKLTSTTHFIHIGTMIEVVGRPSCNEPIDENSGDYPTNEYTRTKLEGENFIVNKCIKDKFRLTVIRPNTIYGKGVRKNSLFDMVTKMVKNRSFITRINWPGRSALIHVEDLTDLIIKFVDKSPLPGKPEKYLAYAENLSISDISNILHKKLDINFQPIIIPSLVWSPIKQINRFTPIFEKILPGSWYNSLWRFGIIINDVVWCGSQKLYKTFPNFKPRKFSQMVDDVI